MHLSKNELKLSLLCRNWIIFESYVFIYRNEENNEKVDAESDHPD